MSIIVWFSTISYPCSIDYQCTTDYPCSGTRINTQSYSCFRYCPSSNQGDGPITGSGSTALDNYEVCGTATCSRTTTVTYSTTCSKNSTCSRASSCDRASECYAYRNNTYYK